MNKSVLGVIVSLGFLWTGACLATDWGPRGLTCNDYELNNELMMYNLPFGSVLKAHGSEFCETLATQVLQQVTNGAGYDFHQGLHTYGNTVELKSISRVILGKNSEIGYLVAGEVMLMDMKDLSAPVGQSTTVNRTLLGIFGGDFRFIGISKDVSYRNISEAAFSNLRCLLKTPVTINGLVVDHYDISKGSFDEGRTLTFGTLSGKVVSSPNVCKNNLWKQSVNCHFSDADFSVDVSVVKTDWGNVLLGIAGALAGGPTQTRSSGYWQGRYRRGLFGWNGGSSATCVGL
jgi:hypothetical protein